ncbi:MAG: serine hydrolase, partial [Aquihabitans sp.]
NTQGVVVVHDGAIVSEWYADGSDQDSWAASWSVAKSFSSALIGIAIDEGKILSVDEPMTTWYPEWANDERSQVTLRDVLQMAPGLEWDESYDPADMGNSDIIKIGFSEQDQLAYASDRPPTGDEPGTVFTYSSGTSMLLSGVLEQATGMPADEYAQAVLFDPIGMEQVEWWRDAEGHTLTYCCVDTSSRGFARFGQLYLNEGRWGDEQIVPESWVDDSVTGSPAVPEQYGYQWWLTDFDGVPEDTFFANGFDGQHIYVIPSLDLVVVRNGTYVKFDGPPVADPALFGKYPPSGLIPGKGTTPPDEWDTSSFLAPIVESLGG